MTGRFTAPASQCPSIDPAWDDPAGVPISGFLFGGRLSRTYPLVFQSFDWEHGVYLAATMGSEATAAAVGQAAIRRDPMAMLPFCGYNMADYWSHWLGVGRSVPNPPGIFRVNWFRKNGGGAFIWPGFGENMRVLRWIVERLCGGAEAEECPFGMTPRHGDLGWDGLDFGAEDFLNVMAIDRGEALEEVEDQKNLFVRFGDRLPGELERQRQALIERLGKAPPEWRPTD